MRFLPLTFLGLIALASGDTRSLKDRTRRPRVKKIELIANLEALVAKLQAEAASSAATIEALQANNTAAAAASAATIEALLANNTASSAAIAALEANVTTLNSQVSTCQTQLSSSFNKTQLDSAIYSQLVSEFAYDAFDKATPVAYKTVSRVSNNGAAKPYEVAGTLIYNT